MADTGSDATGTNQFLDAVETYMSQWPKEGPSEKLPQGGRPVPNAAITEEDVSKAYDAMLQKAPPEKQRAFKKYIEGLTRAEYEIARQRAYKVIRKKLQEQRKVGRT